MNFSPAIYPHKRKLQTSKIFGDKVITSYLKRAHQNFWKKKKLTCFAWHSASAFGFHEKWSSVTWKPFSLYFQKMKNRMKNLVSTERYGFLKIVYLSSIFEQKCWCQQNYGNLEAKWYIFQKFSWCSTTVPNYMFLAYRYPCYVSLSRYIGHRQKWPPDKHRP